MALFMSYLIRAPVSPLVWNFSVGVAMNTDSRFLLHQELRSKVIRLRTSHLAAISRYETAMAR